VVVAGEDPAAFANSESRAKPTPGVKGRGKATGPDRLLGLGVETVGTDAGQAFGFTPDFHATRRIGAGKTASPSCGTWPS